MEPAEDARNSNDPAPGTHTGKDGTVNAAQIVGVVIVAAGIVWVFLHSAAKGEGEASFGGFSLKALTQGLLLVVIGAALVYFARDSDDSTGDELTLSEWATQANAICADGYGDIRALGIAADPESQFRAIPQMTQISTRTNQELQALGRPSGAEERVDRLLALASEANVQAKRAFDAWSVGDRIAAQAALSNAQRTTIEVQELDGSLGANVCALGP
jgi:hypothetical protein